MNAAKTAMAAALMFSFSAASAQNYYVEEEIFLLPPAKHEQRLAARQKAEQDYGEPCAYLRMKDSLADKLGLHVGADVSYTAQRVSPSGKQTAIQGIYYPYLTWNLFKDRALGSGTLNANYNLIRYWGAEAGTLQNRANLVAAPNDYATNQEIFSQLSYTHTLPGELNWLSVTVGQFPLYNFDGTAFLDNQQTALMNYALSQNASSAYPSASLGAYVQAQKGEWTVAAGYQDATNISGSQVRFKDAFDGKYTAFGSLAWASSLDLGAAQYSVLYYYQPAVEKQNENVNGWSVNAQQNLGDKWAVFGRANGSTGGAVPIKNSYVLGVSWLNPFERNAQDALTVGVAYNRLSAKALGYPGDMRSSETAIEMQYVFGVGSFMTITPDVQLYPKAGLKSGQGMSTVVGLRSTIML